MERDELLLDILERIYGKVEKLDADVQEVKVEQARHGIIHETNKEELAEHVRRTKAAEGRLEILEKDAQFFRNFITTVTILGSLAIAAVKLLPYLWPH